MPLAWHKVNLHNSQEYLKQEELILASQEARVSHLRKGIDIHAELIEKAEANGEDGFDADIRARNLLKRKAVKS